MRFIMESESCRLVRTDQNGSNDARHLVLFGLGVQFRDCYQQLLPWLGREPDFLCDNAPEKWGSRFFGKKCIPPAQLCALGQDTDVVITIRKYEEVYRQLCEMGLKNIFVACFDRSYDFVHSIKSLRIDQAAGNEQPFDSPVRGKWTLVTGAARGIGRQIALAMAELGANIIAHSRDIAHTEEVVKACSASGAQVIPIGAELGNPAELEGMLDRLENDIPPVDIVFNNAGISLSGSPAPGGISYQDFLAHYTVNAIAPIHISYRLIPGMINRGYGRIINISSTIQKKPGEMAYACSKAALSKFVHDLAPSLQHTGVMISLVCPGHVRSDMGGANAPHSVESVVPGAVLGALMDEDVNGCWFIAQDYAGLSWRAAIERAKFYYGRGGPSDGARTLQTR